MTRRTLAACAVIVSVLPLTAQTPVRGLTAGPALAAAYDAILDADFDRVPAALGDACASVPVFCRVMDAIAWWWRVSLDPDDRRHDEALRRATETAIREADAWTAREPHRAEAWFARGAAYGVRAQHRVLRGERLAAARDGKRIKTALERALTLDPGLHDARFGLGMYRYYADVAPVMFRLLRWLLLLPGGDREQGLRDMHDALARGFVMRGEAEYQLHLIYLWYEQRHADALQIVRRLGDRYPHNPVFPLAEAEILDVYFSDARAALAVLERLAARAAAGRVHAPQIAARRAAARIEALTPRAKR